MSFAGLVSFEGVAVIAGEPACPVSVVLGPDGGLEGEPFFDGFKAELLEGADIGCQQQHGERQCDGLH